MPLGRLVRALAGGLTAILLLSPPRAAIDEFPPPAGSNPGGITAGPDGAMWFLAEGTNKVHRMTTAGVLDPPAGFPVTITGSNTSLTTLDQLTVGPDGALWFTEPRDNQIGRSRPAVPSPSTRFRACWISPRGSPSGRTGALVYGGGHRQDRQITTAGVFTPTDGFLSTGSAGSGIQTSARQIRTERSGSPNRRVIR